MTVSYTGDVANGSSFGCFWKILGRWKGSVYKLIWRELIAYLFIYYVINFIYRHALDGQQRLMFEKVKVYCSKQIESIPMSFVLGFYVTLIVRRWWEQYWLLPLPDNLALYISSSLHGQDERGRILRRTIMRYTMLSFIITLQRISFRVKKRFPTLQHLVDAGLMMDSEKKVFDKFEEKTTVCKFWMPIVWASNLVNRARLEGRIQSDMMLQTIITELSDFRRRLGRVMIYDTVSVPLVYTQVVTLAVYTYFIAALIGRQWVYPFEESRRSQIYPGYELDLYFPLFLSLQFIFYVGWLKVAETLINPFGEDDDDFELNWLIDRHIQVSYLVVDEMHEDHPELLRDQYWEQVVPTQLPYNIASGQFRRKEPQGSTASMKIKLQESVYDSLPTGKRHSSVVPDEVYSDLVYSYTGQESVAGSPQLGQRKNWIQRQLSRVESFRSNSSTSSVFHRNRQLPQINGGVTANSKTTASRMSFYEKLMNRRSSKDINKNSSRVTPSRALPNGGLSLPKDTLAPPSHSRPRVPTPDVAKETQINVSSTNSANTEGRANTPIPSSNGMLNPTHYTPSAKLQPNAHKPMHITNPTTKHHPPPIVASRPQHTPPPPSDLELAIEPLANLMLSPIEENDGSPYSTSSTNRSSSSYPTTSAIFGRKPSPPPPKTDLPPIPGAESLLIITSPTPSPDNMSQRETLHVLNSEIKSRQGPSHHVNDGFESDDDPYQTILEVGDAKAELLRNVVPTGREYHNRRRLSKEEQEIMIQKLKNLTNKSSQVTIPSFSDNSPGRRSSGGRRHSIGGILDGKNQPIPNEHFRYGSYDKGTNTEVEDVSNNNNKIINPNTKVTFEPEKRSTNQDHILLMDSPKSSELPVVTEDPTDKCEVFV